MVIELSSEGGEGVTPAQVQQKHFRQELEHDSCHGEVKIGQLSWRRRAEWGRGQSLEWDRCSAVCEVCKSG